MPEITSDIRKKVNKIIFIIGASVSIMPERIAKENGYLIWANSSKIRMADERM